MKHTKLYKFNYAPHDQDKVVELMQPKIDEIEKTGGDIHQVDLNTLGQVVILAKFDKKPAAPKAPPAEKKADDKKEAPAAPAADKEVKSDKK